MQVAGVIAEYNPFHRGHAWQLAELRRRLGEDAAVVCAMSGNFVQRGDFAILRKHVRAEAAVRCGADLVLELPLLWATASAEGFARGGVGVLCSAGVVDRLAFGSECADTERILRTAEALSSEGFQAALRSELTKGDSYASARQRAAETVSGAAAEILGDPNDILAVEYCKELHRRGSPIEPMALPRIGAAHDGAAEDDYASASYLRELLRCGKDASPYWPADMAMLWEGEYAAGRAPVRMEALERAILVKLRAMGEEDFAAYDEGAEGLYHRFYRASRDAVSVGALLSAVKTKRYAHARLRRELLAILLGVTARDRRMELPYLRVLAMNDKGKYLLHEMREKASLPVLVKPADVRELSGEAQKLMALEARATDLYALAYPSLAQGAGGSEWRTDPVIVGTR